MSRIRAINRKLRIPPGWGLLLAAAMLAVLLAGMAVVVRPWQQRFLQSYWSDKLAGADRSAIPELVETIAAFGHVALPTLIAGLESDRQTVVEECYRHLRLLMDHWSLLPRAKAASRLAQCGRLLSHRADCRGPAARGMAADLARRLLWMTDEEFPGQDRLALVQHCDMVVALEPEAFEPPAAPEIRLAAFQSDAETVAPGRRPKREVTQPATSADSATPPEAPTPDPPAANGNTPRPSGSLPEAASPSTTARLVPPDSVPAPKMIDVAPDARRLTAESPDATRRTREPQIPVFESGPVTSDDGHGRQAMGDTQLLALMRRLHSRRQGASDDAEAELQKRGFAAGHIELARRLTDPRPSVREALVDELPSSRGIDSRQWLLWLARDPIADVRLAALSVMSTSGDPILLRQVEAIAREDSDPRIVALVDRVLKQSRSSATR